MSDVEKFLNSLDKLNPGHDDLVRYFKVDDTSIIEPVNILYKADGVRKISLPSNRQTPLFDKKSDIVFMCPAGYHRGVTAALWGYYNSQESCDSGMRIYACSGQYLKENYGWYIGSIQAGIVSNTWIVETTHTYVFDNFDKAYLRQIGPYEIRKGLKLL